MARTDVYPVKVVSWFPGNGSASSASGFNWFPEDFDGLEACVDYINAHLKHVVKANEHHSMTIVRVYVPNDITDREKVSAFIEGYTANGRILPSIEPEGE